MCLFISYTVGNKNDDPERKVVITEDAERFARQMDIQLIETSAKENINVDEMFVAITKIVLRHKQKQSEEKSKESKDGFKVGEGGRSRKKSKCC